jgi:carbon-monoxide dehydrogenase large subunit
MEQAFTGRRHLRVEDPRLLTGRGRYVADVSLPGMLEASFVRSTVPHARIEAVGYDFAIGLDGVETVLVAEDLPDIWLVSKRHPELLITPQPPLAVDKVRFVGEAVAMVLADNRYVAEDAADLVNVTYSDLPVSTAGGQGNLLFDDIADNVVFKDKQTYGRPDAAFGDAALVVRRSLSLARQSASPLEPRGCVADYNPATSRLTIYASTQAPHRLRRDVAGALRIPENQVKVIMHDIGGAFGQKIPTHLEEVAVAAASMLTGRPVKWIEDRQENLIAAPHSRGQEVTLELALDGNHMFTALRAAILGDSGAYSFNSGSCLTEAYRTARALPGPYDIEHYEYDVAIKLTNRSPIAPYRGVGFVAAQAARELLIDEAARLIGMDRFALRRRNLVAQEKLPYTSCTGWVYNEGDFIGTLDSAEQMLKNSAGGESEPATGRLTGIGISPYVEPSGMGGEGGLQVHGFVSPSHDAARVAVDPSGKATVSFGTPSVGQGLETTMAQVAADCLGLDIRDVAVAWTDTSQAPMSLTGTRASRAAVVTGGAVARAAREVRAQILEVAGKILEISASDLEIEGGGIRVAGEDSVAMSVADAVRAGFFNDTLRDPDRERTFEATRLYDPPAIYSNACVAAVVEVDPDTGGVEVKRIMGVEDCGVMINPMIVDGQFIGAAVQAIGAALFERVQYSPEEQPTASTLMDYLLPTAQETVRVELSHMETATELTEGGLKGMGESGMIGTVAAIACAVADALGSAGRGVRQLPLMPGDVWALLHQQG